MKGCLQHVIYKTHWLRGLPFRISPTTSKGWQVPSGSLATVFMGTHTTQDQVRHVCVQGSMVLHSTSRMSSTSTTSLAKQRLGAQLVVYCLTAAWLNMPAGPAKTLLAYCPAYLLEYTLESYSLQTAQLLHWENSRGLFWRSYRAKATGSFWI